MKLNLLAIHCLLLTVVITTSCKKEAINQINSPEALTNPLPSPAYAWTSLGVPDNGQSFPSDEPRLPIITVPIGNTYYAVTGACMQVVFKFNNGTKRWERQPGYGEDFCLFGSSRYLFTHQSKLYYGLWSGDLGAFGSFDPLTGIKTPLARFPGADSVGVDVSFVIGDNGYLFFNGGYGSFWRYNFPTNQWTNMGESPAGKRHDPAIFVVGNKVYIGLGWESATFGGQSFRSYKKDWKLVTIGSAWAAVKADFPGDYRSRSTGFVIGDNIFVGFGFYYNPNNNPHTVKRTDFWKYNTVSNTWTRQADFPGYWGPGMVSEHLNLSGFALGNSGYIVTGGINEFWRFANTPLIVSQ